VAMTRPQNGTLKGLGLGFVLAAVASVAVGWGAFGSTQADHERRIAAVEDDVKVIRLLVTKMAAVQGIELPKE